MADEFKFDLDAKRTRHSDEELISALEDAAQRFGGKYFTEQEYGKLLGQRPHSSTIANRFGSWKRAVALIGIIGGREYQYAPEELIENLETVWKRLGYPPGKRKIVLFGKKISETPYKRHWGSLRNACEALAAFHSGQISRGKLLAGTADSTLRSAIPLKDRWAVLKRDNYRCVKCGASPATDHSVELEVDRKRVFQLSITHNSARRWSSY